MLRTPLTLTAAATAAMLVLAGCGTVRLGSAAVTNTDRISSATVAAQVSNLNQAHQADKAKVRLQFPAVLLLAVVAAVSAVAELLLSRQSYSAAMGRSTT